MDINFKLLHHCLIKHEELMNRLKEVNRLPFYVDIPDFSKALIEEFGEALAKSKYHWWRGDGTEPDKYEILLEVGDMLHFVFSMALKSALHTLLLRVDTILFLLFLWNQINQADNDQPMVLFLSTVSSVVRNGYMNYYDLLTILKAISKIFDLDINDMLTAYLVKNEVNMMRIENNWNKSKDPNAKEMLDRALRSNKEEMRWIH